MDIFKILDDLQVAYTICEHEAVYTVAEAGKLSGRITLTGAGCKNLFLRTKKKQYFLYVMPAEERADIKRLAEELGVGRMQFASEEELRDRLGLIPGSVTPLGIVNDTGTVEVIIDQALVGQDLLLHPCRNTATISLAYADLVRLIEYCGNPWRIISCGRP